MILEIVEDADALDATSASAACFADLGRNQGLSNLLLIVHPLFTLSSHLGLQFRLAREFTVSLFAQASLVKILLLHRVEHRTELRYEITLRNFKRFCQIMTGD